MSFVQPITSRFQSLYRWLLQSVGLLCPTQPLLLCSSCNSLLEDGRPVLLDHREIRLFPNCGLGSLVFLPLLCGNVLLPVSPLDLFLFRCPVKCFLLLRPLWSFDSQPRCD